MSFKLSWCLPRRHRLMVLLLICLLLLAAWAIWIIKPYSEQQVKKSILQLERRSYFVLYANGEPLLTFSEFTPDSVMTGLSFSEDSVKRTLFTAGGFWVNRHVAFPSCNGRLLAVVGKAEEIVPTSDNAKLFLRKEISYLTADLKAMRLRQAELRYYLRVHGVQDEGYDIIAKYATRLYAQIDTTLSALEKLRKIGPNTTIKINQKAKFTAKFPDGKGQWQAHELRIVKRSTGGRYALLQTLSEETPQDVKPLVLLPWKSEKGKEVVGASFLTNAQGKMNSSLIESYLQSNGKYLFSDYLQKDGCPIFTPSGTFIGMKVDTTIIYREELKQILKEGDNENK